MKKSPKKKEVTNSDIVASIEKLAIMSQKEFRSIRIEIRDVKEDADKKFKILLQGLDLARADIIDIKSDIRFLVNEYSDHEKRISQLESEMREVETHAK